MCKLKPKLRTQTNRDAPDIHSRGKYMYPYPDPDLMKIKIANIIIRIVYTFNLLKYQIGIAKIKFKQIKFF